MKLRNYQENFKKDLIEFIDNSRNKKGLGVSPVGTGKSLYPSIISEYVNEPCLVLQPSSELLKQNVEKAHIFGIETSIFSASLKKKEIGKITYATHKSVINHPSLFKDFKYVVIDEAHMHLTNKLKNGKVVDEGRLVDFLNYINPNKIIGLTATPVQLTRNSIDTQLKMLNRSKSSYWCFADMISTLQIGDIKDEWWSNVDYRVVEKESNLLVLNTSKTDFTQESLEEDYEENNLQEKILQQYEQLKSEGKKSILIFVPSIKFGENLQKLNRNIQSISANTPSDKRDFLIESFKKGEIDCLVNTGILTTGFDHPELDAIIMARETNSFVLYYQIVGRLVRLLKDLSKTDGVFVDLTNTYKRFGKVDDITFEKQDYTKGWAMWNSDNLMTGVYLNSGEIVTREEQINSVEKQKNMSTKAKSNVGGMQFHFGKYKYKTVRTVCQKDMRYIQWLLNNEDFVWKGEKMLLLLEDIRNTVEELRIS